MRYLSLFSGVESATLAWKPLGWKPVAFAEFDPFPSAVLAHHYPDVPNLGDVTKIKGADFRGSIDLIVGGSPCQGFSVAGKQLGLNDERSALALAYVRLLEEIRPRWFVWENVPGVLSTNGGEDFRAFIEKITEIGYGVSWRILDAQYVRVPGFERAIPQRRRRIFVVGYLGDWRRSAQVLFESQGLSGDIDASRETGQDTTGKTADRPRESSDSVIYENHAQDARYDEKDTCPTITRRYGTGGGNVPLVLQGNVIGRSDKAGPEGKGFREGIAYTLNTTDVQAVVTPQTRVRKLTPLECERLMGFPDDYTKVPFRGKSAEQCPDSHRYKACGNSMCVNVMRWIGQRIQEVEKQGRETEYVVD